MNKLVYFARDGRAGPKEIEGAPNFTHEHIVSQFGCCVYFVNCTDHSEVQPKIILVFRAYCLHLPFLFDYQCWIYYLLGDIKK